MPEPENDQPRGTLAAPFNDIQEQRLKQQLAKAQARTVASMTDAIMEAIAHAADDPESSLGQLMLAQVSEIRQIVQAVMTRTYGGPQDLT